MSLTKKILEKLQNEISKEDLNTLLFLPIYNCIYPYYYMIIVLFVLILLLLILILFILIFKK